MFQEGVKYFLYLKMKGLWYYPNPNYLYGVIILLSLILNCLSQRFTYSFVLRNKTKKLQEFVLIYLMKFDYQVVRNSSSCHYDTVIWSNLSLHLCNYYYTPPQVTCNNKLENTK